MTLQERQQREIRALKQEIEGLKIEIEEKEALIGAVKEDPEFYFKEIDEEENKLIK